MRSYPAKSYQRMYDPSLETLWDSKRGLSPDEDGDHHSSKPEFFEWWYFDAALDSGERLVIIFHSAIFNLTSRPPAVDIRLTSQDSDPRINFKVYTFDQFQTANTHCDVQIADCQVVAENPQKYVIKIRQDDISADLVYDGQLPGWKPGTGYLFYDDGSGHFFKWVVPIPLARVSGTIQIGQQKISVDGVGYHDHNWGNFHLADAFSHWHWGRFISSDKRNVLVFGDVVGKGNDPVHVQPVLLIVNEQIQSLQDITIEYQEMAPDERTGVHYSKQIQISSKGQKLAFDALLNTEQALEALTFASPFFRHRNIRIAAEIFYYLTFTKPLIGKLSQKTIGNAGYLRFQSRGSLQIEKPFQLQKTGDAIYEIMSFD